MMSRLERHGSPNCHDTETLTTCHSNYGLKCEASVQNRQVWFWSSRKKNKKKNASASDRGSCLPNQSPHQIMCYYSSREGLNFCWKHPKLCYFYYLSWITNPSLNLLLVGLKTLLCISLITFNHHDLQHVLIYVTFDCYVLKHQVKFLVCESLVGNKPFWFWLQLVALKTRWVWESCENSQLKRVLKFWMCSF